MIIVKLSSMCFFQLQIDPKAIIFHGDTRSSMFIHDINLLSIDYYLFLNRTKDYPKIVRLSLFQEQ